MNGTMILFQFHERTDRNTINKFMQKFYGRDSSSWKGRYKYHRLGFLEDIPHRKILRGVVILRKEDREKVLGFLNSYSLTLHVIEVKLTPDDEEILRRFLSNIVPKLIKGRYFYMKRKVCEEEEIILCT